MDTCIEAVPRIGRWGQPKYTDALVQYTIHLYTHPTSSNLRPDERVIFSSTLEVPCGM